MKQLIYENKLSCAEDVKDFRLEGRWGQGDIYSLSYYMN